MYIQTFMFIYIKIDIRKILSHILEKNNFLSYSDIWFYPRQNIFIKNNNIISIGWSHF